MFLKIFGKSASWIKDSTRLEFTEQELDLFADSEMFLFIDNSIRSGISVASHRYAKANNPLVPDYDHKSLTPISLIWMLITFMVEQ